jgi:hypothetical protein
MIVVACARDKGLLYVLVGMLLCIATFEVTPAVAAGTVAWSVRSVAEPTNFSQGDAGRCASEGACDRYQLLVANVGDQASAGPIAMTDTLPPGIVPGEIISRYGVIDGNESGGPWECTEREGAQQRWIVTCSFGEPVGVDSYAPALDMHVSAPPAGVIGPLHNDVSVTGGEAAVAASTSNETPVHPYAASFGLDEFDVEPVAGDGSPSTGAGAHPWALTTGFGVPLKFSAPGNQTNTFQAIENLKEVTVELPLGLTGDPLASSQRCTQSQLESGGEQSACPAGSKVGSISFSGAFFSDGGFAPGGVVTPVFNLVPEGGYPAEFAFKASGYPVYLYASVVHSAEGYRLRVVAPGITATLETVNVAITFFGDPGKLSGGPSGPAFLTNPMDCSAGGLSSRIEVESWENPGHPVERESITYPQLSGCDLLGFNPSLSLAPSAAGGGSTQADEPSGYTVDLKVPQTSGFSELATPEVKDVSVSLPEGLVISPSAADGLVGCDEAQIALDSTSAGGCPLGSQIGTVEALTPILASPLQGHVYLAQPKCGGEGQPACTAVSATNGELYGLYLEVQGPGFVLKFPGAVSADPSSGRLTARFENLIQQPFSDFVLHLKGGPRAPLANPQTCGQATTSSDLTPWSSPTTPHAVLSSAFNVDWDGNGGACPASLPFAPSFSAGSVTPSAGGYSAFSVTFSRQDREQDLSGLSVSTPPGLLGKLAGVPLCGEPQAAQGTCSDASRIGTTQVAAGAGPHPFWVTGRVYLTTGYKGAPFGLSVVVPAVAGPFNLGDVIVRAAIHVDEHTSALTISSDPLPQIVDGVPLRIQTVNVTVDRPGFVFNPTNCSQQQVTGTLSGAQGASASVSSRFAVTGCAGLPFKPVFKVSTQAKTGKKQGASLDVKVGSSAGYPEGHRQANIHSVAVTLPKQLPARLSTIQQACLAATFAADPAGCPAGSNIGTATASTPILSSPLTGPAYLVSHGGAAFPDLVVVLQGEGITLDLVGGIDIKKGVTSSTFASIPDAPIGNFELRLPESPHSGLAAVVPKKAKGKLCGQALRMPTTITAQNGAVVKRTTKIAVTGCPNSKPPKKTHKPRKAKKGK